MRGAHVFFTTIGGLVVATERVTGKELWPVDTKAPVTGSPPFVGDKLVIGGRNSQLQALDPAAGARSFGSSASGARGSSPPPCPPRRTTASAYVGSSDLRRVVCFDVNDGRIRWRTDVFGCPWGRPLVTGKFIYAGLAAEEPYMIRHEAGLVALDRATGKIAWRLATPKPAGTYCWGFPGSPVRAGNLMLIGDINGTLHAFPIE